MEDGIIRSLSLTRNCMQSEGELRFCISLYEILVNRFKNAEKRSVGAYHWINFCDVIEEYDPQTNEWREVGKINLHEVLFYRKKLY